MRPDSYKYIFNLSLSCPQGGKGQVGAALRKNWFRNISGTLQRMHAISFRRNLAIARGEFKPTKIALKDMADSLHLINSGSHGYFCFRVDTIEIISRKFNRRVLSGMLYIDLKYIVIVMGML